jgi:hypothetical protein
VKFIYSHGGYAREMHRCVLAQYPNEQVIFVDDNPVKMAISYEKMQSYGCRNTGEAVEKGPIIC